MIWTGLEPEFHHFKKQNLYIKLALIQYKQNIKQRKKIQNNCS